MINFLFNKIFNDQDFAKLTGGTRQRGGGLDKGGGTGQRRIRYIYIYIYRITLCLSPPPPQN